MAAWARLVVRLGHRPRISPWSGLLCGMGTGMARCRYLRIVLSFTFRANQIVAGMGINMLALGVSPVLCKNTLRRDGLDTRNPARGTIQYAPLWLSWICVAAFWLAMKTHTRRTLGDFRRRESGRRWKPRAFE